MPRRRRRERERFRQLGLGRRQRQYDDGARELIASAPVSTEALAPRAHPEEKREPFASLVFLPLRTFLPGLHPCSPAFLTCVYSCLFLPWFLSLSLSLFFCFCLVLCLLIDLFPPFVFFFLRPVPMNES